MSNVLKVKIRAQRIRYEVMKITFEESDLEKAKGCKWVKKGNSLYYTDNKLDSRSRDSSIKCVVIS